MTNGPLQHVSKPESAYARQVREERKTSYNDITDIFGGGIVPGGIVGAIGAGYAAVDAAAPVASLLSAGLICTSIFVGGAVGAGVGHVVYNR